MRRIVVLVGFLALAVFTAWSVGFAQVSAASAVDIEALRDRIKVFTADVRKGDLDTALPRAPALLDDARAAFGEDSRETLAFAQSVAFALREAGRVGESTELIRDVVSRARSAWGERDSITLRARLTLGHNYYEAARWREAALEFEDIAGLAEGHTEANLFRYAQLERVLTYTRLGRLGEAAELGQRSLEDDIAAGRETDEFGFTLMENLAGVYADLGRHDEAIALQVRATELMEKMFGADDYRTLASIANVVQVYRVAGRPADALPYGRRVAAIRPAASGSIDRNTLIAKLGLAELLLDLGRYDEALAELDAQEVIAKEALGDRDPHVLDVAMRRGQIALAQERYRDARASLGPTCDAYDAIRDTQEGFPMSCRLHLGNAMWHLGERREALGRLASALTAFEQRAADGLLTDVSRQSLFASRARYFRRWVEWSIDEGAVEDAFQISERLRGRALLQSIVYRHADESTATLPAEASAILAELKQAITRQDELVAREPDAGKRVALIAERDRRYRELQAKRAQLAAEHPRYGALLQPPPISRERAARALPARSIAVTYAFGEKRLHAFVLRSDGTLRHVDLGDVAMLASWIDAWRALLSADAGQRVWTRRGRDWKVSTSSPGSDWSRETRWQPLAAVLGQRLVLPVLRLEPRTRDWIVVPDGILASIPLEATIVNGRPLVMQRGVRYVQSLGVLAALASRSPRNEVASLLSVGDPDYGTRVETPPPGRASSSFEATAFLRGMSADATVVQRAFTQMGIAWPPLPATRSEVEAVTAAFAMRPTHKLLGGDASEARLQSMNGGRDLRAFRYLHFATHAYLSVDAPALSAIVLAQSPGALTPLADGYVTAAEWPGYDLDSDLVVLSGCETGRGRAVDGEGITGLPYAMFVAGNRNAVMTLWKVADAPSAEFVADFFGRIARGTGIARSLAQTKRLFATSAKHAHPRYWAAFVQYGAD